MALVRHLRCFETTPRKITAMHQMRQASIAGSTFNKAFIGGQWLPAISGKMFEVMNPYDGKVVGVVPNMNVDDCKTAIEAASSAFEDWKHTTAKERSSLLRTLHSLLVKNETELARLITLEAGKPQSESLGEVQYGNSFIEWFSEEARRINGEVLCSPAKAKEMLLIRQPIGVAALITPWNFPLAMLTRKAGAALAAGCTCVVKPAEDTPLTALALAALVEEAGFPKGVFNVVTCDRKNAPAVGKLLCTSELVAGISFTGSTEVGKLLYRECSQTVKRVGLELGGNAPFLVFQSADLDKAVQGAMASKFRNCGQACVSANRFIIHEDVFDEFIGKLKNKMQHDLVMGSGSCSTTNLGPLINDAQAMKVSSIVDDAVKKGAKVLIGGKRAEQFGTRFYEPTLLTDIREDMTCYREEIFGPVAVCVKFKSEEDAVAIANDTNRGLAGYFYSNDVSQIWRVAKKLAVGMVGINEGMISAVEAAFGGIKESGIGREGSSHGIEEYVYIKYLCFGNL